MIIFPKKDIIPIMVPQVHFNDKYNNINSYIEMNPSINIDETGKVTILVRCVNYRKYKELQFTLYGEISNSIFYIINGNLNKTNKLDIEHFDYNILNCDYNLPIYPTLWKGVEDIRFVDDKNILVIVPELNILGNPSIFKAEINNNTIVNFNSCKPDYIEKNWMPYFDKISYKVIYSLEPFLIKSIETDEFEEIELSEINKANLKGYHGSTNGLILNDKERLFLIHINKEIIYHRWLLFNIETKDILLSLEFIFFKNSYIEFPCSLSKYNDRIFISIGINDNKAFIIETTNADIISTFTISL
jgi:hypothetical protein